ncbi:H+-ATPase subunit E/Vma4 [Alkalibacterium putridalgicola]|uniref:H+-ATPase subunit E/Vma4 n=1 Tax=Alkalibacterium putridalgicola TaxID=426703 RepID=A0A1H7TM56_9LACT|nr:hypothetical protein [Alkalibacterium putridalgicola]GEK88212.1 hypothetical protein APU01nite_02510 [Alkalibacterium putridalgicola]SEL85753.1 H+-ATPase subunit E/Vma4 [Alkalibacterium putridalgicola]
MDIEEKIDFFREMTLKTADEKVTDQLESFEDTLKEALEDHKAEQRNKAAIELDAEKDNLRKESNKHLAQLQLQQQRDLHKKQQQLKEEVFVLAEERVSEFMQTNDYIELLKKQLQEALNLAKGEDITLYIDPVDSDKKNMLEKHLDHDITLSERPFIGGSRGVIQSRKLLIDNSFLKRFEEEKANFSFDKAEEENAK